MLSYLRRFWGKVKYVDFYHPVNGFELYVRCEFSDEDIEEPSIEINVHGTSGFAVDGIDIKRLIAPDLKKQLFNKIIEKITGSAYFASEKEFERFYQDTRKKVMRWL